MKKKYHIAFLIFLDYITAVVAWVIFYFLRKKILSEHHEPGFPIYSLFGGSIIGVFWIALYSFGDTYINVYRNSRIGELAKNVVASLVGVIIIFFVLLLDDEGVSSYQFYYKTAGNYFLIHFLLSSVVRLSIQTYFKEQIRNGKIFFKTLIIGCGEVANNIYQELEEINYTLGNLFLGYVKVNDDCEDQFTQKLSLLGEEKELESVINDHQVEQVIIAIESEEHKKIEGILSKLKGTKVRIQITPDVYQILLGAVKVEHVFAVPLIEIKRSILTTWQTFVKRSFDVIVSCLLLIIGIPFYLTLAVITKMTSPGPVFFSQERVGKDGVPFQIYKFRSMYMNAENGTPELSSTNDPRVTKWGRFMRRTRLDESPQFLNVLKGDMSIVGPRPERKYYIDQILDYAPHYKHLLSVRPGITSLGQVKYGYAQNINEMVRRMKYDIVYIENMSFVMDLRIIFFTIPIILQGRGK